MRRERPQGARVAGVVPAGAEVRGKLPRVIGRSDDRWLEDVMTAVRQTQE